MEEELVKKLDPEQLKAVSHGEGPMLVLAGPGTGKTRVITHRISHLIKNRRIPPQGILAVTFTRKAAEEMKKRVEKLTGEEAKKAWIGTFHSICLRILRRETRSLINYKKDFLILSESEEQKSFIRKCIKKLDFGRRTFNAEDLLPEFDKAESRDEISFETKELKILYDNYKKELAKANFMTFNDLLLLANKLLSENKEILSRYQSRFSYVLVDEYQDANIPQNKFIKLLSDCHKNLFVVGDDDQSIYRWRGVDAKNILNFERDFKCQELISLKCNYRSTETILTIATEIIRENSQRREKNLRTSNPSGDRLVLFFGEDGEEEASFVANMISEFTNTRGFSFKDIAVFYRANFQSRAIEDALNRRKIQYVVKKGKAFYRREEIMDILAYLRLILNPKDQKSFERIINIPPRGIANIAVERVRKASEDLDLDPLSATEKCKLPPSVREKLAKFADIINTLRLEAQKKSASQVINKLLHMTNYLNYLGKQEDRVENVKELLKVANEHGESSTLDFIDSLSLSTDEDNVKAEGEKVSLMTVHAAKGLEFPIVFVVGVNDGRFPDHRSASSPEGLEEERRLFYVAVTRAEKILCISCHSPSVFVNDISSKRAVYIRSGGFADKRFSSSEKIQRREFTVAELACGHGVRHEFFGEGTVKSVQGERIEAVFPDFRGMCIVAVFYSASDFPFLREDVEEEIRDINTESTYTENKNSTALHDCLLVGDAEQVSSLIEKSADVNTRDKDGNTPLHLASLEGTVEIVSLLIDKGARLNAKNKNGDTSIHLASRAAKMEIVSLLVERGADINSKDEDGDTPLHDALSLGNMELASFLIENGANAEVKNNNGQTPLHFNSFEEFSKLANSLVQKEGAK
ncbi:MAG: UvrD-helicase domain-containing protein [Candidatus Dadabacteria bacterium]|nr:UvrD-helicase domain-containing protein [Candidatus Dadabacteria bacterium]